MTAPLRTSPASVLIGALGSLQNGIFPALAIAFSGIGGEGRFALALAVGLAAVLIGSGLTYAGWRRLTYVVGENDIRVESGIFTRQARSVPYERIQDVSLAQPLLARLLGLVSVKFETGAGGGEDLSLTYLSAAEGTRLRQLVRERRDEEAPAATPGQAGADQAAIATAPATQALFAMGPARIITFGLFEFSLGVFALLFGLLQYADNFLGFDFWDVGFWEGWLAQQGTWIARLGPYAQAFGVIVGLFGVFVIGVATGLLRTIAREWGFVLERTARGLRRRRGLFTRTDVVMPVHRVQALVIGTSLMRYRFGWHSLSLVSLASDNETASHVAAPFARLEEIAPIAAAVGFRMPGDRADWQRASKAYRTDKAVIDAIFWLIVAGAAALFAPIGFALIPLGLAFITFAANLYAWEFRRHAIDETQIFATQGVLAPQRRIATRLKLHSVEIAQGPIARLRGYATLHLGLAGGELTIAGLPVARARELRREVLATICATDFAHI